MKKLKKILFFTVLAVLAAGLFTALFTIFFDQAVLVRKGTIYHVGVDDKIVALTFDDGPSPEWTPKILDALKKSGVKATFFMLGKHVEEYPDIAKRVAEEGHDIGNHTYVHPNLLFYNKNELKQEIKKAEDVIYAATGVRTKYFRPPKAWLSKREKAKIKEIGYKIILWSLNSKDWVTFDDKYIIRYLVKNVRPGDIILFHDSGGAFSVEGGDRHETVLTIPRLVEKLEAKGYRFVTITELLKKAKEKSDE